VQVNYHPKLKPKMYEYFLVQCHTKHDKMRIILADTNETLHS